MLFFVGDSITAGAKDTQGGWVSRLIEHMRHEAVKADFEEKSFHGAAHNLGVSGNTITDILLRLKEEIKTRLSPQANEKIQIVYAAGVNDSVFMVEENRPRFTDLEFKTNLERLIEVSKEITENICFLGLLPVNDDLLNPVPWAPDKAFANENIKRFDGIIEDTCKSYNLPFLPLFDRWMRMPDYKLYFADGVHPNAEGHFTLAEQIKDFLLTDAFFKFHSRDIELGWRRNGAG